MWIAVKPESLLRIKVRVLRRVQSIKYSKPFYTTQPGATGLGLANVRRVIEIHGGGIQVTNREHGGALFILKLPRIQAQQVA